MNIVGKILIFLMVAQTSATTMKLKVVSMDGGPLQEAGAGQPFLAQVIVQDAKNTAQRPVLKNTDGMFVTQSGFQMNMINGATTIIYQYQIRIDKAGTFTLGPATLTENNTPIESNTITLTVAHEQKVNQLKKISANSSNNFLRLTCNNTRPYVGEKVPCILTFYTNDDRVTLRALNDFAQSNNMGFTLSAKSDATTGNSTLDGVEYRCAQWHFDTYPTRAGTILVPAYSVDFTAQTNQGLFGFFFAQHDTKRLYSNTLTLEVKPLPATSQEPLFIGTISSIQAKITPANTCVGQGMLLTIAITGQGNFEKMNFVPLHGVPESLKWYESKQSRTQVQDGTITHTMEYVIQATAPGDFSIPPQECYYFDTKEKQYKMLKTVELALHISPDTRTHTNSIKPSASIANDQKSEQQTDLILPLLPESSSLAALIIPWSWYWYLIMFIALAWLLIIHVHCISKIMATPFEKRKSIYKKTKQAIKAAQRSNNYQSFYSFFITLYSKKINREQCTAEDIDAFLRTAGLSSQALTEWKEFFSEISLISFGQTHSQVNYRNVLQRALYWVDVIEKLPGGLS